MTETPLDSPKGESIDALRQRVSKVESRFLRIDHEAIDYRRRLSDLMAKLEDDQRQRHDDIKALEEKIEGVVSENEQLRGMLDELLTAAETFGEIRLDEPLADLDARVRGDAASKDIIGEAAARIGEARSAAADQEDSGEAGSQTEAEIKTAAADKEAAPVEPEPEALGGQGEGEDTVDAVLDLKPAKETEPEFTPAADGEPEEAAETIESVEPDELVVEDEIPDAVFVDAEIVVETVTVEAGPDVVELAANEASEDDVLELEAEVVEVEVEIVSPAEVEAAEVAAPTPPTVAEPEVVQTKPEEAVATGDKAAEKAKAAEITTDKETDQLDRILASIRRISSAL
ncbi:MAG: hypothetical protein ACTSX7_13960 [Alphaproteobacteria bacterium]